MFSGIGGFELGIGDRGKCVGYSEIDKYAIQIYEQHFDHRAYGDCTAINTNDLPDFDLLVGGFPCQAFSVAGKRRGFNDTRGTLFFELARVLREKTPNHFLFENVKGLLSHDQGRTFQTILGVLSDIGYFVEWQVLNSKDFGVPQNRERVFIVGHLGGYSGRKVFPIGGEGKGDPKQVPGGVSRIPLKFTNRNQKNIEGDYSYTVDSMNTGGVKVDSRIRRLTPTECERLQGFPDGWTKYGRPQKMKDEKGLNFAKRFAKEQVVSDTQRYKCLGNAVTVNVVDAVVSELFPFLRNPNSSIPPEGKV